MPTFKEISTQVSSRAIKHNVNDLGATLKYPNDLGAKGQGQEAFMIFDIVEPVKLWGGGEVRAGPRIALYLPPTLNTSYGAQYEDVESLIKRMIASGQASSAEVGHLLREGNYGAIKQKLATSVASEAIHAAGGAIDKVTGADLHRQIQIQSGHLINPHMAVAFTGVPFRTFEFQYQMMAREESESFTIREIIRQFKENMHPSIQEGDGRTLGRYWLYPNNFKISFYTPVDGSVSLFRVDTCALTGMDVNYAGSNVPTFFGSNGMPVDIRLTLRFKELRILTKEDFTDEKNF